MGRTEQFAEVSFAQAQTEGDIVKATVTGVAGQQLVA